MCVSIITAYGIHKVYVSVDGHVHQTRRHVSFGF